MRLLNARLPDVGLLGTGLPDVRLLDGGLPDAINRVLCRDAGAFFCCIADDGARPSIACWKMRAISWACSKRSTGSFASALRMTCSAAGGRSGRAARGDGGGIFKCLVATFISVCP